jgi:hypothetical protein
MTFRRTASLTAGLMALALGVANAQTAAPKVRVACRADFQRLCPEATPGHGAVMQCLRGHMADVGPDCKSAIMAARDAARARRGANAPPPAPASPQ